MKGFRLGVAPTRRNIFSREEAIRYKGLTIDRVRAIVPGVAVTDMDGINDEGLLFAPEHVEPTIRRFREAGVDAVFVPHCNFGSEDLVARVAKAIGKPLLLWGPRDDEPTAEGDRLRDSQCGLFATGKVLRRYNVPFTYITNCRLGDETLERGVRTFVQAAAAAKAFKSARILQIGPRPQAFLTMMANEGELLERFGIEVVPMALGTLVSRVRRLEADTASKGMAETLAKMSSVLDTTGIPVGSVNRIAAIRTAMTEFAGESDCGAIALQCWDALQESLSIMPCTANGLLTDDFIPVTCETDIHGAVTALMAQAARGFETPVFFADLTVRHPTNDNAELLYHCGPFPPSLAKERPVVGTHRLFTPACHGISEFEVKGGDITISRFDGDHGEYSLFIGKARGTEGPKSWGSYMWVEVNDWPLWEHKLVTGPYVHHCVGIHGDITAALHEACRYIPGLKPDPVDPTTAEIEAWLRGNNNRMEGV